MDYKDVEQRADVLLDRRGIKGHVAAERFVSDFKAYLIYFAAMQHGDASTTLALLENDSNLTPDSILENNFRMTMSQLVSATLMKDPIFPRLFKVLYDNKGKGVGAGELILPLLISGYTFSNSSDGRRRDGSKVEVKKSGASLKPVKRGIPGQYEGLVDDLNKKYFQGTVPGKKSQSLLEAHLKTVKDPGIYAQYFQELYIGCDTKALAEEIKICYKDPNRFNTAIGKFALREYQKVDDWCNLIIIDAGDIAGSKREKLLSQDPMIVNLVDLDDLDDLDLKFNPVLARRRDTQAIADGYVNISI